MVHPGLNPRPPTLSLAWKSTAARPSEARLAAEKIVEFFLRNSVWASFKIGSVVSTYNKESATKFPALRFPALCLMSTMASLSSLFSCQKCRYLAPPGGAEVGSLTLWAPFQVQQSDLPFSGQFCIVSKIMFMDLI